MRGLKVNIHHPARQHLAEGGMVRGPGTGTSDSVPDELPEGSYVLPADTTQAVGQQTTAMLNQGKASAAPKGLRGAKVPVQLSNGEMKLMPEQVHAIGIDTLEKMKAATHTPVAEQNQDQTRMFFANGGAVFGSRGLEGLKAMIPQMEAMGFKQNPQYLADGGQPRARWQDNLDELQNPTPYQGQVGNLFLQPSGTAAQVAAIRPGVYRGDAGRGAVNPPAVVPQNISPSQGATDPASASMAGAGRGTVNPPMANPSAPAPTNAQAPGGTTGNVTRVGNSYSGTNVTGDITVNGQAPQGGFMVADGPRGLSPGAPTTAAPQGVTAPTARRLTSHELRNLEVSASSITNNGGRFDPTKGNNTAQTAYKAALANDAAAQTGQFGLDSEAMRQNGALQREGIQQEGANTRDARGLAVDRERLGIDSTRAQSEVAQRGVETAGAQQLQNLRNTLTDPNATPAQRKQATEALQALSGRQQQANRYTVVPGGQEWDATAGAMRNVPARVLDNQSGQFVQGQGAGAQQPQQRTVGQVFTDANGKKATWDGQKYVPL